MSRAIAFALSRYDAVEEEPAPAPGGGALGGGGWAYHARWGTVPRLERPSRWAVDEHPWGEQRAKASASALRVVHVEVRAGRFRSRDDRRVGECRALLADGTVGRGEHYAAATRRRLETTYNAAWEAAAREIAAEDDAAQRKAKGEAAARRAK